tara:strand:- start:15578 stop:16864 length:1287 start_codon:yes stop_codon:yes gene_type:complete
MIEPEIIPTRSIRDLTYKDVPNVVSQLQEGLGLRGGNDRLSVNDEGRTYGVIIDWNRITELVDTVGNTNYTFAVVDEDEDPYTFHNLIIGKNEEGYWKRPYLLTYVMGEEFRPKYDATGSTEGFTGKVLKRYITSGLSSTRASSNDDYYGDPYVSNDPCDKETEVVNPPSSGGGGGGGDYVPPNIDDNPDMGFYYCYAYWIDFDYSGPCDATVCGRQSILVTVCEDFQMSAAGSDPCDEGIDEVAIIDPEGPCPGDPLKTMKVASSGGSKERGGTFGDTRANNTQFHDGVDLKATPGTTFRPIKAGRVIYVRDTFDTYEYKKDSYGNKVIVRTTLDDGSILDLHYNHMDEVFVRVGDEIDTNTLVGETGQTGNAARESVVPHLHVKAQVTVNGVPVTKKDNRNNPALYMNSVILGNGLVVSNPCIINY